MHITRERIRLAAKARKISFRSVCAAMGVGASYLSDESTINSPVPQKNLETAAKFLFTTVAYLKGETDEFEQKEKQRMRSISRLEAAELTTDEDAQVDELIHWFLKNRGKEK